MKTAFWTRLLLLSVAWFISTACQTSRHTFPTPGSGWSTRHGQLKYSTPSGRSFIGEVIVRQSPRGDFQLAFYTGPSVPLMQLYRSGDIVRAEGALARGTWEGARTRAPRRLAGWVSLPDRMQGQRGEGGVFELQSPETGERFHFRFGP